MLLFTNLILSLLYNYFTYLISTLSLFYLFSSSFFIIVSREGISISIENILSIVTNTYFKILITYNINFRFEISIYFPNTYNSS